MEAKAAAIHFAFYPYGKIRNGLVRVTRCNSTRKSTLIIIFRSDRQQHFFFHNQSHANCPPFRSRLYLFDNYADSGRAVAGEAWHDSDRKSAIVDEWDADVLPQGNLPSPEFSRAHQRRPRRSVLDGGAFPLRPELCVPLHGARHRASPRADTRVVWRARYIDAMDRRSRCLLWLVDCFAAFVIIIYMTTLHHGISVVVPAYNSADLLPELVARLGPVLTKSDQMFELIIVNDGSRDNTWPVVERLATANKWVRGICMMRNYGQHNALLAGIRAARYEVTVTMDDDLQHPPEELLQLFGKFAEGYDVVYAPPLKEQHGVLRDIASILTKLALQSAMGAETARNTSAWRIFRTQLRDAFAAFHSPFVSIDVLLTWGTTKFGAIPLRHDPRPMGQSNYTVPKLIRHALNMMTGFSVLPLQLASVTGFAFTLFGGVILAYVCGMYLVHGSSVAGFPFLASIIAIFSGAQLFALGIIGEYLARMHFRTMDKPTYTVLETADSNA